MKGSCLCGAVRFEVGQMEDPLTCHCIQCRKQTGHYFAAGRARKNAVRFETDAGLAWYRASDMAARGFCQECGSTLFWRADEGAHIRVALGALDGDTGLKLGRHVWVDFKGDYYDLGDGLPEIKGEDV